MIKLHGGFKQRIIFVVRIVVTPVSITCRKALKIAWQQIVVWVSVSLKSESKQKFTFDHGVFWVATIH